MRNRETRIEDDPIVRSAYDIVRAFGHVTPPIPKLFTDGPIDFEGTPGDDGASGTKYDDALNGYGGNDTLRGAGGNDNITGGDGNDKLFGDGGSDSMDAGAGLDNVNGGSGDDGLILHAGLVQGSVANGGSGEDTLYVDGDGPQGFVDLTGVTIIAIEHLQEGANSDTTILLTSRQLGQFETIARNTAINSGLVIALGGSGKVDLGRASFVDVSEFHLSDAGNTLTLTGLATRSYLVEGGAVADKISGGNLGDILHGNGGSDTLVGGKGADLLDGGVGRDWLQGGGDDDAFLLRLGEQNGDRISGGPGFDTIFLVEADPTAKFNLSGVTIDADVEQLSAASGDTTVILSAQQLGGFAVVTKSEFDGLSIEIKGAGAADLSHAQRVDAGTFTLSNLGNSLILSGQGRAYTVIGGSGDDVITAGAGDDLLSAGGGHDTIVGGAGADRITGGGGMDRLTGGGGGDAFIFRDIVDALPGSADEITDFSHKAGDGIDLSAIDPDGAAPDDQSFTFIGSRAFSASASPDYEVRVEKLSAGLYQVQGDVDHDGIADFAIDVHSAAALTPDCFSL